MTEATIGAISGAIAAQHVSAGAPNVHALQVLAIILVMGVGALSVLKIAHYRRHR